MKQFNRWSFAMRPLLALLPVLAVLLSGCYETRAPVVAQGVRAEAIKDGRWRRSDGSELVLAWNAAQSAYRVDAGGEVRLAPVGKLWLADYQAERNVVLLAGVGKDQVVLYEPTREAEARLMAAHGLGVRPGPVNQLSGDETELRRFLGDLAKLQGSGELREAERLTWVGPS